MNISVTLSAISDWSDAEVSTARELSRAVYPPGEVEVWPGRHLEWATAEWGVRVTDAAGMLVSYCGVVIRTGRKDGELVRIGGVGGVKTHPSARRLGHAELGIRRAIEFFRSQPNVDFALLVCEPHLRLYYKRFGWRDFHGRLMTTQYNVTQEFTFNQVMVFDLAACAPDRGTIDLQGPPW